MTLPPQSARRLQYQIAAAASLSGFLLFGLAYLLTRQFGIAPIGLLLLPVSLFAGYVVARAALTIGASDFDLAEGSSMVLTAAIAAILIALLAGLINAALLLACAFFGPRVALKETRGRKRQL